jgi:hypothetical protein
LWQEKIIGPYAIGNIRICTVEENHREMRHSDEKKNKMKGNKYALGLKHTKETKLRIGNSIRGRTWKMIDGKRVYLEKSKNAGYDIFGEPL